MIVRPSLTNLGLDLGLLFVLFLMRIFFCICNPCNFIMEAQRDKIEPGTLSISVRMDIFELDVCKKKKLDEYFMVIMGAAKR